ncbi:MAG TPA: hypothetical protein VLR90_09550 [Blastocatellia bacterium]|nr:hypothetical protein [Blastocatellia bacterium]
MMIKTVERIEISETTTSFRIHIDNVNSQETLDQRYHRHRDELKDDNRDSTSQDAQSEQQ